MEGGGGGGIGEWEGSMPGIVELAHTNHAGHKLLRKYKGIFLWDEHGQKRKDLPTRDDLGFEKKLESREQLKDLLEHVKSGCATGDVTAPTMTPTMTTTVAAGTGTTNTTTTTTTTTMDIVSQGKAREGRAVKIEEISCVAGSRTTSHGHAKRVPQYWCGWLAVGVWRTQVFLPGEVSRDGGLGLWWTLIPKKKKEESMISAFQLSLDGDNDVDDDAGGGNLYLETGLFQLCITVPSSATLPRWKAWFDRKQTMLYLEGIGGVRPSE